MAVRQVIKTSGESEEFSSDKLMQSIILAGADEDLARQIEHEVEGKVGNIESTDQIHEHVFDYLKKDYAPLAARYNLRRAIIELGPTGFPFEKFSAEVLNEQGYETMLNQIIQGQCVEHEVDIIAKKDGQTFVIENKFHKRPGIKSGLQTALYLKSRFDDIKDNQSQLQSMYGNIHQAWLFTNTKISSSAIKYAQCKDIKLTGWTYPNGEGLGKTIDRLAIHPITAMTKLTKEQKAVLLQEGVVLCKQIKTSDPILYKAGLNQQEVEMVKKEADAICAMKNTI